MEYYSNVHVPLAKECFGPALKRLTIDSGISSIMPGSRPPFHAIGSAYFDSVESFYEAVTPHIETFQNDAAKYCSETAVIQISEIAFEF